jgi:hypothetical protein
MDRVADVPAESPPPQPESSASALKTIRPRKSLLIMAVLSPTPRVLKSPISRTETEGQTVPAD